MANLKDIRKRLIHEGLKETDNLTDYYLLNKHVTRHLETLRFMKANNLKLSSFTLTRLYRLDVVIRKEIVSTLMPIELSIVTKLQYWIQDNNIDLEQLKSGSVFEDVKNIPKKMRHKAKSNYEFIIKSLEGIGEKWNTQDLQVIIFQMSFGQVSTLIRSLPKEAIYSIIHLSKKEALDSLEFVVSIRNYIFHLGQLFINGNLVIKPRISLKLNDLVKHISNISYWDYKRNLESSIRKYEKNLSSKANFTEQEQKELLEIFSVINSKMFGV